MKKPKRLILIIVAIVVAGACVGLGIIISPKLSKSTASIDKTLMEMSSEINENLPFMIDKDTRLDNTIVLSNKTFRCNCTLVNWVKDSTDIPAFERFMKDQLIRWAKNPELKTVKNAKVTLSYSYVDRNGDFVCKIDITPDMYMD